MLAVQRVVIDVILVPDTPGGLRLSMDCRIESSSATAEDMVYQLYSLQQPKRQSREEKVVRTR